jgi:hypothetical protein
MIKKYFYLGIERVFKIEKHLKIKRGEYNG